MKLSVRVNEGWLRRLAQIIFAPLARLAERMFVLAVNSIEAQGTTIAYSTETSPSSFATIGNVVSFNGPDGGAPVIDVSNLASTRREKRVGLPDEGQFTLELNLDPDLTAHQALRNNRANRTRTEFRITFTDTSPTTATFWGYILSFAVSGAVDGVIKASVSIEIDGPITWA